MTKREVLEKTREVMQGNISWYKVYIGCVVPLILIVTSLVFVLPKYSVVWGCLTGVMIGVIIYCSQQIKGLKAQIDVLSQEIEELIYLEADMFNEEEN